MSRCLLYPHSCSTMCFNLAVTSIRAELPSWKVPTTLVLLLISRGGTPAPLEELGDVLDPPGRDAREVHLDDGLLVEQRVERLLDGLLHQILKSLRSDSSSTDTMFADAVRASAECEGTYCPLHLASIHVTRTRGAMDNSSEHARASLNLIRCSPLDSSFGFTTVLSRSWISSAPSALARLPWRARRGKCTG